MAISVSSLVDDLMRMKCMAGVQTNPDGTLDITAINTLTKQVATFKKVDPKTTSNQDILREAFKEFNK